MDIKDYQFMLDKLGDERKENFLEMQRGERLPNLYSDVMIKHILSPELHPERLDFLLKHVMKDRTINVDKSASNEGIQQNEYSKKLITDIPAWLKDGRLTDVEIQTLAQDFIHDRADVYASDMLLIQYSAEKNQKKSEINYENIKEVILVVLMRNSPDDFKKAATDQYIHKVTEIITDTGIRFNSLKKMVFVQLDKALDIFRKDETDPYGDDEILKFLALIADVNDNKVKDEINKNAMLKDIRDDALRFSQDKEVQAMLLAEQFYEADLKAMESAAKKKGHREGFTEGKLEGKAIGRAEGIAEGKDDDIKKLAKYFMGQDASLSEEEAVNRARSIIIA